MTASPQLPAPSPSVDVAIVGGGIAGLAAAYELLAARRSVRRARARARAPAASSSAKQIDGFTIDGGPDSLLIQKPEAIALCQEIGLGDRLVSTKPPRIAYIQRGGRLHALPAASVLGIPTRVGPFVRTRCSRGPASCAWAPSCSCRARRDEARRVDRRVHDAPLRRARRRPIWPSRCWPAFTPATSIACRSARCFRASSTRSASTAACCARSAADRQSAIRSPQS